MRERSGHRGIPYAMEEELRDFPVAQRSVLVSLAFEAMWEPGVVPWRGQRITLDVGEALVSYEGLVRTLRLASDPGVRDPVKLVRRALASGCRLGLIDVRAAVPEGGTPCGTGNGTYRGTPHGTPPRIVRFLRHRPILWPDTELGTPRGIPRGTPCGTEGGTIPQITGTQGTGTGSLRSPSGARATPSLGGGEDVFLTMPCRGGGAFAITEAQVATWAAAYPTLDVPGELRRALAWLVANPAKHKTLKGTPSFCVRWLRRTAAGPRDRGGGAASPVSEFSDYTGPLDFPTGRRLQPEGHRP
jgi:hypothetical protein